MRSIARWRTAFLIASAMLGVAATAPDAKTIASLDLAKAFAARSPWRFTAVQSQAAGEDAAGNAEPGAIALCISKDGGRSCTPDMADILRVQADEDYFAASHYLADARIVHPSSTESLLLIQVGSVHSGDGDQRTGTQLFTYDRATDAFEQVYAKRTSRNNNQEVRYIAEGPLQGAMISAEPTQDAPFGYWITVSRPDPALRYRQALRYRSATRYGDNNPLAVIDSEMPNLRQRLGLWKPGMALPLPAGKACPKPHLVKAELWCA